ncbi:hypothetical protein C0033_26270 [Clostridium sp. chh4-2]|uniref:immunoglobulin-like domain-containing protein n=1 Tax=Clostridium sp. chh4-2 TaxID=2067550 RepID=UPI000CCE3E10|nr:immunoglobulin-like domain-containing protein [Clostridium sp. chh4-2]PNV59011.1 hypothetical protein C0033_26270 [Clostridium sp. chh4-2]
MKKIKYKGQKNLCLCIICLTLLCGCSKGQLDSQETSSAIGNATAAENGSTASPQSQEDPSYPLPEAEENQTESTQNGDAAITEGFAEKNSEGASAHTSGYSDEDLINMAKAYYLKTEGAELQLAELEELPGTYSRVSIWLGDAVDGGKDGAHGVTRADYNVNRHTAQGTDTNFNPVDLTDALPDQEPADEDFYSLATDIPAADVEQFAKRVKQQLLTQDWNALAEELSYPITVDGVTYNSREEFLAADFETELNPYFFVELEEEDCKEMFCNWSGVMLGETGRVWIIEAMNEDFSSQGLKVRAINGLTESFGLPGGVRMNADESDITPTSIKLRLENETDLNIIFGDDYRLQKEEDGTYKDLLPKDMNFHSIGYMSKRGNPVEWTADWSRLCGSLEDGNYIIVKTVLDEDVPGEAGRYERAFGFTIGAP